MNEYSYQTLNVYKDAKALVVDVYRLLNQLDISVDLEYITKEQFADMSDQIHSVGKQLSALRGKYVSKD